MFPEFPQSVLQKHPEMVAVGEALAQWSNGEPVTARCHFCGEVLVVERIEATGTVVVRCPRGDTFFRAVHAPTAKPPA
jgi:phage FluMu protein Com